MAEITKPDMSNLWASDGAVIAPTGAKIKTGWTPEIPPHQWENFVQNRQDNAIAYLFQRGVPGWDSSTEYFNNKSLVMGSNGVLYRAVSNNAGVNPTTDSGSNWISLTANASESVAGIIKIATTDEANALVADDVVITPKKLGDAMNAHVLGFSQVWQNVMSLRSLKTTYTNTTGKPIFVCISAYASTNSGSDIWFIVNEYQVLTGYTSGTQSAALGWPLSCVVPAGATYRLETNGPVSDWTLTQWSELR